MLNRIKSTPFRRFATLNRAGEDLDALLSQMNKSLDKENYIYKTKGDVLLLRGLTHDFL